MRRVVTRAIGIALLIYGILFGVMLVIGLSQSTWFHGKLPPDTRPANASQAEDVAFSIASNAGCGGFDNGLPPVSRASWVFGCDIGETPFAIYVYGDDNARATGLAELRAGGRPFVAQAYYAVTVLRSGASKTEALSASPPPDSIMDPFR